MRPKFRWFSATLLGFALIAGCQHSARQARSSYRPSTPMSMQPAYSEGVVYSQPSQPAQTTTVQEQPVTETVTIKENTPESLPAPTAPPAPVAKTERSEGEMMKASFSTMKEDTVKRRSFADITAKPGYCHADDYTWLKGELQYVHVRNTWKVRYASVDEEDRYGGSVTLTDVGSMNKYQNGQMVRIEGQVVDSESRETPCYRVRSIEVLPNQ